jgi:hypothetical protein
VNNQADPANPSQDVNTVDQQSLSDFAYAFGQFMDHDMDLTQSTGASNPIAVALNDVIGGPSGTPLAFTNSQTDPKTGTSSSNPLQDVNSISAYLDLSQVYGSDSATDNALRTFSGGLMKTSPGGLPPLDNTTYFTPAQLAAINAAEGGMANGGPSSESQLFVTGDTRGNENVELTALQSLFLDNHNLLASVLQQQHPNWTDQQLFNEARKLNIAEYQEIVYNGWIPAVLGTTALPAYKGYNPNVNPGIADEFSTVAFRFGHSMLDNDIDRDGNNGLPSAASVPLSEDFFDPTILNGNGQATITDPITGLTSSDIGALLKADADGDAQATDVLAVNAVRNELFNEVIPGVGYGQDLIALDIQRAREQGIGSYNEVRQALGLKPVTSFAQITSNVQVQQELQQAYGNVNNIDAFEGGLAENHVAGSDVGPLFQAIMANQFARLRNGDRFFYLNETFDRSEQALLQQGNTLAKIIEANTNITNLQSNVFQFQASISGTVSQSAGQSARGAASGIAGLTLQLEDSDGNVLATTVTDRQGHYTFNQLSGPGADVEGQSGVSATGIYQVVLELPTGLQQTTTSPAAIAITRGGMTVTGINFGVRPTTGTTPGPRSHSSVISPSIAAAGETATTTNNASASSPGTIVQNSVSQSTQTTQDMTHSSGTLSAVGSKTQQGMARGMAAPASDLLDRVFDQSQIAWLWDALR